MLQDFLDFAAKDEGSIERSREKLLLRVGSILGAKMALIQDAVVALLARAVFWRSSQGKRLSVGHLTGGRPPMTISARR
jgi:hypothetical protein